MSKSNGKVSKAQATPDVQPAVGMAEKDQKRLYSTVARERFVEIIANNQKVIADATEMMVILNEKPHLDESFCRMFGIKRNPENPNMAPNGR